MSFLATVLPGVREIRGPLASGVLWLVFLGFLGWSKGGQIPGLLPRVLEFASEAHSLLGVSVLVLLPFVCYLTGIVASFFVRVIGLVIYLPMRATVRVLRRVSKEDDGSESRLTESAIKVFRRSSRVRERLNPVSSKSVSRASHVKRRVLPDSISEDFPVEAVLEDRQATLLDLASKHPEQYQQVDRAEAESEFRSAVAPPILALVLSITTTYSWLVLAALVIPLILLWQSLEKARSGNDLLWTASYLGLCEPPILRIARERFEARDEDGDNERWWIMSFLRDSGVSYQIVGDYYRSYERGFR